MYATNMAKQIKPAEMEDDPLTPAIASAISGLSTGHLARMASAGKLTVSKPGGTHRRYVRSEIEALAEPLPVLKGIGR